MSENKKTTAMKKPTIPVKKGSANPFSGNSNFKQPGSGKSGFKKAVQGHRKTGG